MAGSQLKRLKAKLKDQGIIGPSQSKKQRREKAQEGRARNEKRIQRTDALEGIREQFNPFDLKHATRGPKFDVTSLRPATGSIRGRPGQAKAASEDRRKETLLVEMQRRNRVGGILDRRFGEDDPTMTPEEKMLERFAREKQRSHKKSAMFDLEDDYEDAEALTHGGKALTFEDEEIVDDFQEDDLDENYDSDGSVREQQRLKRVRAMEGMDGEDGDQPERKKSKKEVMEEVIAKSKMYKYERQAAKEEDLDLRMEIDQDLPELLGLLSKSAVKPKEQGPASDRVAFDKDYDLQVKKLALDKRAQPADRTKTDEEKVEEESERLRELEEKRQKRMRGESVSDSESEEESRGKKGAAKKQDTNPSEDEDDEDFGLGEGIKSSFKSRPTATELGFDDEDDFLIDDDLVASGSDIEIVDSDESDGEDGSGPEEDSDEDDEFTRGLLNEAEISNGIFSAESGERSSTNAEGDAKGLPFTFPCPQSFEELQTMASSYPVESLPTIVQRIRALYHPKLDSKNKERLGNFAMALVDFIAAPWDSTTSPPFSVLESLVRHIHSLAKSYPPDVAGRFRHHLQEISDARALTLLPGDLILLTAVGTVFPTSDHFHQVVTPSTLTITRYLGQKVPQTLADHAVGLYLSILSMQFQQLAKRYVPEVINFSLNSLCALAPVAPAGSIGNFPRHTSPAALRISNAGSHSARRLAFADCLEGDLTSKDASILKVTVLDTTLQVLDTAVDTWVGKSSFMETFGQAFAVVKHLASKKCRAYLPSKISDKVDQLQSKLERTIRLASLSRRPLELHHHRPLAIKTYIPKFEDTFDPNKHYDPDRERAEMAKLKAEHKKERKGAMRELRKDANFMARENLRVKKAKDEAYEKKFKRLVSEIQSEEGRESNIYEREKSARKRTKNR